MIYPVCLICLTQCKNDYLLYYGQDYFLKSSLCKAADYRFYIWVCVQVKQTRSNMLISELQRCWEVDFVTFAQSKALSLYAKLSQLSLHIERSNVRVISIFSCDAKQISIIPKMLKKKTLVRNQSSL